MDTPAIVSLEIESAPRKLMDKFKDSYESQPTFVVRVPGRVNIIGEHIDYCGYSVLPMALEHHLFIAVQPTQSTTLKIVNVDPKYSSFIGDINDLSINLGSGVQWYNYVLCGIRGISETLKERKISGMLLAVAGYVLPNAGLSSSSALVCAAALATSHANGLSLSKQDLATLCSKSERYIGTEGGGMDQAIAFLANPGCAKHISFRPIRATDVKIPAGLAIVVAHSCAEVNKASSDHFNQRVAECRLSAVILAKTSGLPNWKDTTVLADVQSQLNVSLSHLISKASEILSKDVYSKEEICQILELSPTELDQYLPINTRKAEIFKLQQRTSHVFAEALRVNKFQEYCENGATGKELGQLMNLSHDSLRDLYECSHPQLDTLVSLARKSGALGARLTGAGWGGCMVALTTEDNAASLISSLSEGFYSNITMEGVNNNTLIFHSKPGSGAVIFQ